MNCFLLLKVLQELALTRTSSHQKKLQTCNFDVNEGQWYVERFGPFDTHSEHDTLNFWYVPSEGLQQQSGVIGGTMLSVTNYNGSVVPYPPVHMHHFHLWHDHPEYGWTFGWQETHGDSGCLSGTHGTKCYMQVFPTSPNYGMAKGRKLFYEGVANLVTRVEKPLWIDMSLLLKPRVDHLIKTFSIGLPLVDLQPYAHSGTSDIPPGEFMAWAVQPIRFDFRAAWMKWHLHADFHEDVIVFVGKPIDVGLDQFDFVMKANLSAHPGTSCKSCRVGSDPIVATGPDFLEFNGSSYTIMSPTKRYGMTSSLLDLKDVGQSMATIQEQIKHTIREKGMEVVALLSPKDTRYDGPFERRPLAPIVKKEFKQGEFITTVVFYKTNAYVKSHTRIDMIQE